MPELMFDVTRYSRDALAALSAAERRGRLLEMEERVNVDLTAAASTLSEYQTLLYQIIEEVLVKQLGYSLVRWEYESEIELWGGMSYRDRSITDGLILRSEFPRGVALHWGKLAEV